MPTIALADHSFTESEQPTFPGSPYAPVHPLGRKIAYVGVACVTALGATLGNALVTVNVPNLAGAMGLYVTEASLLTGAYIAFNACANLLLVRARIEFGIPRVTHVLLSVYVAATLLQWLAPSLGTALLARACNGLAAAGLTTLTIYNLLQVTPVKARPLALCIGITLPQFGTPIARMIPVEMLALGHWQGLHLIELGLALAALAALNLAPLPPSVRSSAFKPLDALTIGLVLPGMILLCAALSVGRLAWWTDTPWVGWALAGSVPLFAAAIYVEARRKTPLLQIGFLSNVEMLRWAALALLVRFALAEQTYGAVGLLTAGGLTNDQLRFLFLIVCLATLLGMAVAALALSIDRLPWEVAVAALIIGLGAWIDTGADNVTRPMELYLSQGLIGFGTALFIGPALVYGLIRVLQRGPAYLVSVLVIFGVTQNVGGLLGSAILGSIQFASARAHAASLAERLTAGDPQVTARLQAGAQALGGALADPGAQASQGAALLGQSLNREANILAFNDVFAVVAWLSVATAAFIVCRMIYDRLARGRPQGSPG